MGCLHTKPKLKPQTIVVHSCDYHSNGVARILKPRAATPDRYASSSAKIDIVSGDVTTADHPKFVRKLKPRPTSPRSPPASPHITLPSTPEADRNTIQVLDAEDLEPAEYCPLPEAEVETTIGEFEEQSVATASRVKLKASPGSAGSSQVNSSKQSTLSSQDTLTVEELDTEMDDFNRLRLVGARGRPFSESHLTRNRTFVIKHEERLPYRPNSERIRPMTDVAWS